MTDFESKKTEFLQTLVAELRKKGHEVDDNCREVDGIHIHVDAQEMMRSTGRYRKSGSGLLYATIRVTYNDNCVVREGSKNGINYEKAVSSVGSLVKKEKARQDLEARRAQRREKTEKEAQEICDQLGISLYGRPTVKGGQEGLEVKLGIVTKEEATAVLKLLLEMRTDSRQEDGQ